MRAVEERVRWRSTMQILAAPPGLRVWVTCVEGDEPQAVPALYFAFETPSVAQSTEVRRTLAGKAYDCAPPPEAFTAESEDMGEFFGSYGRVWIFVHQDWAERQELSWLRLGTQVTFDEEVARALMRQWAFEREREQAKAKG